MNKVTHTLSDDGLTLTTKGFTLQNKEMTVKSSWEIKEEAQQNIEHAKIYNKIHIITQSGLTREDLKKLRNKNTRAARRNRSKMKTFNLPFETALQFGLLRKQTPNGAAVSLGKIKLTITTGKRHHLRYPIFKIRKPPKNSLVFGVGGKHSVIFLVFKKRVNVKA